MPFFRFGWGSRKKKQPARPAPLRLEALEDRTLLDAGFSAAPLDLSGIAVNPNAYDPSRILVEYRPGTAPAALPGTTVGPALGLVSGLYEIDLASGVSAVEALAAYRADPQVQAAELDYDLQTSAIPTDPKFSQQWDLRNTGQSGGVPGADIHAAQAWDVTTGSYKTVVAVMDTGIDYNHPDLYQNVWINQAEIPDYWYTRSSSTSTTYNKIVYKSQIKTAIPGLITFQDLNNPVNKGLVWDNNGDGFIDAGDLLRPLNQGGWDSHSTKDGDTAHPDDYFGWNFVANTNNPFDDNGHGTHVSGTIGAMANDGRGVAGIDWQVSLMAVKFLAADGSGSISTFIQGLNYAVAHGAKISNNSWTGADNDPLLYQAIYNARQHGQIFVAAAGNDSANNDLKPTYPASFGLDNVVAVAATDNTNRLADFSNYGAHSVALGAPGVDILSTLPGGTYGVYSGTSMATPHVTGVLALVWSEHPTWSYQQVINQVLNTVDKVPSLVGKTRTGGVLDAAAAVGYQQPAAVTPRIVANAPGGSPAGTLGYVRVTFNEPMDPATFTPADVLLTGPGGRNIGITGVQLVSGSNNTQFLITFANQTQAGSYTLRVGPGVYDYTGHAMAVYEMIYTVQSPYVYTSAAQVAIPHLGKAVSNLTVGQSFYISDVTVTLNIKYSNDSDLYIHLEAPDGTDILLVSRRGGSGQNFTNTLLSDNATTLIRYGTAPFTGSYRPEIRLGNLAGKNAIGTWRLWVEDKAGTGTGVLVNWTLAFNGSSGASIASAPARVVG